MNNDGEKCDHQWILPRYFEAQYRNGGLVTGTCIKCRHRLRETIECWIEMLREMMESDSGRWHYGNKPVTKQVIPSFVEQLGRKFRVVS